MQYEDYIDCVNGLVIAANDSRHEHALIDKQLSAEKNETHRAINILQDTIEIVRLINQYRALHTTYHPLRAWQDSLQNIDAAIEQWLSQPDINKISEFKSSAKQILTNVQSIIKELRSLSDDKEKALTAVKDNYRKAQAKLANQKEYLVRIVSDNYLSALRFAGNMAIVGLTGGGCYGCLAKANIAISGIFVCTLTALCGFILYIAYAFIGGEYMRTSSELEELTRERDSISFGQTSAENECSRFKGYLNELKGVPLLASARESVTLGP